MLFLGDMISKARMSMHRHFLIALFLGFFLVACGVKEDKTVLKLGHVLNEDHPVHKGIMDLAKRVEEKSGGQMRIDVYPGGQLGGERELLELLQIGSLAMTKVSAATMEGFAPKYKVLSLPYLFRNDKHRWAVLNSEIGREILSEGEQYWLRGLSFYDAGSRSFYTADTPIRKPSDLKGLKIRVMNSQTAIQMVDAFGGSATPISFGELYTAIQQGVVDGAENNPPSFFLSRHYEVAKYYSLNEHASIPDVLIMSTHVWDNLSKQEQKWLQEAANESVETQKEYWAQSEKEALQAVKEAGVEVIRPDKSAFAEKVQFMHEAFKEESAEMADLIERIKAKKED